METESTGPVEVEKPAVLLYPEYRWTALDAWKWVGMILVLETVLELMLWALDANFRAFRTWSSSGAGFFSVSVLHYAICVLTAAYFARTETLRTFLEGFGLNRRPSDYVWLGISVAIGLRILSYSLIHFGLAPGARTAAFEGFARTTGVERLLFIAPAMLAPFAEETYMRGFVYKAFRGSFPVWLSMTLVVGITVVTHWVQYRQSWAAAISLTGVTVVQCYLREKSDSLWDCIWCHFAFNASGLLASGVLRDLVRI